MESRCFFIDFSVDTVKYTLESSNSSVETVLQAQKEHKLHSKESFSVKNELLSHFLSFCGLPTGIHGYSAGYAGYPMITRYPALILTRG